MKESTDLFLRLQADLAALINATPPGERLLSEPKLALQLGVSRATLREAMRTFEEKGFIRRRQGLGTFVVEHKQIIESGLEVLESIHTLARRIQLDVTFAELQVSCLQANADQAKELGVAVATPLVQVIRVIKAEGRPVAYLVDLLPETVINAEEITTGFTGSVLDQLLKKGTLSLAQSKTEIRAEAASAEVSRSLEIQRGDALLFLVAYLYNTSGQVVDYSFSYFLPGYFRFHVVRQLGKG